jgi:hypothetical protein
MTARHYAQPEAVANARSARVIEMLQPSPAPAPTPTMPIELTPRQLIERLSPGALAELAALLRQTVGNR